MFTLYLFGCIIYMVYDTITSDDFKKYRDNVRE